MPELRPWRSPLFFWPRLASELIETSKDHGVRSVGVPFDLHAGLLPDLVHDADQSLADAASGMRETPELTALMHHSATMNLSLAVHAKCR